jgi:DNA-binding GntR family transcriptional regulator
MFRSLDRGPWKAQSGSALGIEDQVSVAENDARAELNPFLQAPGTAARDGFDGPVAESIAKALRERILQGRLEPGRAIRQESVASELGASRVPVREALRQLEAEGLVTILPRRGARVATLDFDECVEIYRMREALETLAIVESAPNLTPRHLAELKRLLGRMESSRSPTEFLDRDRQFHTLTYAGAPMPRLLRSVEMLWNATQQYRRALFELLWSGRIQQVHAIHRLIFDALERGDGVDAARYVASHIHRGQESLAHHPELFAVRGRTARGRK